ncbi:MAG: 30S ribosomal protein S20 [Chloroflexi bacterium]|nr:30S ribosomal protein S20 [Chloroflexota bacterium]MCZ6789136.1 30S ribosomal protein S20 [Chloroflexota bacterium]
MPSEKTARRATKRYSYNLITESSAKTYVRTAQQALSGGSQEEAQRTVRQAMSILDRAVKRGAIHANTAARRKSRLNKSLNTLAVAPPAKRRSRAKTTRKTA